MNAFCRCFDPQETPFFVCFCIPKRFIHTFWQVKHFLLLCSLFIYLLLVWKSQIYMQSWTCHCKARHCIHNGNYALIIGCVSKGQWKTGPRSCWKCLHFKCHVTTCYSVQYGALNDASFNVVQGMLTWFMWNSLCTTQICYCKKNITALLQQMLTFSHQY